MDQECVRISLHHNFISCLLEPRNRDSSLISGLMEKAYKRPCFSKPCLRLGEMLAWTGLEDGFLLSCWMDEERKQKKYDDEGG